MTRLAAIAVERGWERIDFQVLDWNPARRFYRRLGIEHLGDWLRYGGDAAALRRLAARDLPPRICPTGLDPNPLPHPAYRIIRPEPRRAWIRERPWSS
jgi:hypothetical protein